MNSSHARSRGQGKFRFDLIIFEIKKMFLKSAVSSPHLIALLIQILDLWLGYYIVHSINPHIFLSTKTFFNFIFWYRYHVLQQYSGLSLVYFQDFSRLHKMMNNEYFSNFLFDNLFYQYEVSSPKIWFRLELYLFRVLIYALQISLVKLKIIKKPLSGHFQPKISKAPLEFGRYECEKFKNVSQIFLKK